MIPTGSLERVAQRPLALEEVLADRESRLRVACLGGGREQRERAFRCRLRETLGPRPRPSGRSRHGQRHLGPKKHRVSDQPGLVYSATIGVSDALHWDESLRVVGIVGKSTLRVNWGLLIWRVA